MLKDSTFSTEFYEILKEYEHKFTEAVAKIELPDNPNMAKIETFVERINRYAVMGNLK